MRLALPTVLLCLFIMPLGQTNCWRGITPLRSTCEDVKKALNIQTCSGPPTTYEVPELHVMISFAAGDCTEAPRGWRVPKGTVTGIVLSPRIPMTPAMFDIDLSKYKKREDGEIVGIEHYTNEEEGVTVDMYAGVIQDVYLYPRKADEPMRCKAPGKTKP